MLQVKTIAVGPTSRMESPSLRLWPVSPTSTYESRSVSPILEEPHGYNESNESKDGSHVATHTLSKSVLRDQGSKSSLRAISRSSSMADMSCTSRCKPALAISTLFSRITRPSQSRDSPVKSQTPPVDYGQRIGEKVAPVNGQHALKNRLKHNGDREPDPKYLSTMARTTATPLKISRPMNFRHLTHAGQREFSDITSLSQNDLIADFSAIRASQNSREDLRGIQAQAIHSRQISTDNNATARLAGETDSLHSNDVPSLASGSSQDSVGSARSSAPNSEHGMDESTRSAPSPVTPTKPNFSFSRPFRRGPPIPSNADTTPALPLPPSRPQQLQAEQPQPQPSSSLSKASNPETEGVPNGNSGQNTPDVPNKSIKDDVQVSTDRAVTPNSDYHVTSLDYSPAASFAIRALDAVHEASESLETNPGLNYYKSLAPPPLRIGRGTQGSAKKSEPTSPTGAFGGLKEPNPPFLASTSSRPGSGASNSTITPQSLPGSKARPANESQEPITRSSSSSTKPSVTFDRRVSVITLEEPSGLFSAWGLDDEDSSILTRPNKVANTTTFEPLNQSASAGENELDDGLDEHHSPVIVDTPLQRQFSNSSNPSVDSGRRKLLAVSSMDDSLGGLRKYSDNPVPSPLEIRRPSERGLHKLHRSNNDIFQEKFLNKRPNERNGGGGGGSPTDAKNASIVPRTPWSPILSRDIEDRSVGTWDQRTTFSRSVPSEKGGYISGMPPSVRASKPVVAYEENSPLEAAQVHISASTLNAWETGASRINATPPIPEASLDDKRSAGGRRRLLRKRPVF